jgi:delta 1-pyrroline-5-carboxylate dehydrogenase
LQSQASYYLGQKVRFYAKVEVMDDILTGMMEDLLENGSFDESQKVHDASD